MTVVTTAIEIAAPPERVWEVVMDPRRLGDWVTIHDSIGADTPARLSRGSQFDQTMHLRGAKLHVAWTVVELVAPRRAEWSGRGPARSHASIVYQLDPTPTGTCFEYVNDFRAPGGPLGAVAGRVLMGGLSQREAQRSLERLQTLLHST